jgi:hypothetical protein
VKPYRVYCFDGASRIVLAEWIEAANDCEGLKAARVLMDCFRSEVWDKDRLVGRIEPRDNSN